MPTILIDTNVLLYLFDADAPQKQAQAALLLRRLSAARAGCLSVQCLSEFISVATRRLKPPLTPARAMRVAEGFAASFPVYDLTTMIVLEAARGARDHGMSFYDAQLWASARLNQIATIFSEDFRAGTTLESVRFINPFAPSFQLAHWA